MPNWVRNIVKTNEETMEKIREKYFTNDELDFNKVIPMPKTLNIEESSINEDAIVYYLLKKSSEEQEKILSQMEKVKMESWTLDGIYRILDKHSEKYLQGLSDKFIPHESEKEIGIKTFEDLGKVCVNNLLEYGCVSWFDWCVNKWGTKWNVSEFKCNSNTMIFETAWGTPLEIFEKISNEIPDAKIELSYADECYSNLNNGKVLFKDGIKNYLDELDEKFAEEVWNYDIEEKEGIDIADNL